MSLRTRAARTVFIVHPALLPDSIRTISRLRIGDVPNPGQPLHDPKALPSEIGPEGV
jgi:hypothetical protein